MEFVVNTRYFKKTLQALGSFLPAQSNENPLFADFFITLKPNNILTLCLQNEVVKIKLDIVVDSFVGTGKLALPADTLIAAISKMDSDTVKITGNESLKEAKLVGGSRKMTIKGHDPDLWQDTTLSNFTNCEFDKDMLVTVVSMAALSASNDSSRPAITGIYFDVANETFSVAATDSFRLTVIRDFALASKATPTTFLLPYFWFNKACLLVSTLGSSEKIAVKVSDTWLQLKLDDIEVSILTLEAEKYPQWQRMLPDKSNYGVHLVFPVDKLLKTVDYTSLLDKVIQLQYQAVSDSLNLKSVNETGEVSEDISAVVSKTDGKDSQPLFVVANLLTKAIQVIQLGGWSNLKMCLDVPGKGILITPDTDDPVETIVMPMSR